MNLSGLEKLGGAVLAVVTATWALARHLRLRRPAPEEVERARRLDIHQRGRITSGQIVDLVEPETSERRLVVYTYEVAGLEYEVAQDLTGLPEIYKLAKRMAGRAISLKYDPKRPSNSIMGCEQWSGIATPKGPGPTSLPAPSNALQKP